MKNLSINQQGNFHHTIHVVWMSLLILVTCQDVIQAQTKIYITHRDHTTKVLQLATNSKDNGTPIQLAERTEGNASDDFP